MVLYFWELYATRVTCGLVAWLGIGTMHCSICPQLIQFTNASEVNCRIHLVQDEEFSGPQVGEDCPDFALHSLLHDSDEQVDLPLREEKPTVIIFVHEITRPAFGLIRTLASYLESEQDHVHGAIVFLTDDINETRRWAKVASSSLPKNLILAVSPDGKEGDGSLGLNRKMTLTILLVKGQKVVGNFALVQPSDQVDAIKICRRIADAAGIEAPSESRISELRGGESLQRGEVNLRTLLVPVIRVEASMEEIQIAAEKVQREADMNPEFRRQLGEACRRIVDAEKLENYGNEHSQAWIKKWADEYR
ncbi:MAG TPA: hypothetical protein PKD64_14295 [Pirellulaceae bacterium]|nr:hypothetical protein [Pirellulaceae bacterium]HMO93357.1 hypothetical protein [Pirellulaceae bacterium]HMP70128.1 hypothetical protein [Pirellulaceae bacterium]